MVTRAPLLASVLAAWRPIFVMGILTWTNSDAVSRIGWILMQINCFSRDFVLVSWQTVMHFELTTIAPGLISANLKPVVTISSAVGFHVWICTSVAPYISEAIPTMRSQQHIYTRSCSTWTCIRRTQPLAVTEGQTFNEHHPPDHAGWETTTNDPLNKDFCNSRSSIQNQISFLLTKSKNLMYPVQDPHYITS